MDALITQAGQFIQTHQAWAGPIIFLMTFGESMLIIGILLPATVLLMMSGGLIGSGTLSPLPIFLWGFAGAVLGDALSYWIGKWLGPRVLRLKLLKAHRRSVARARLLCFRYGFLAVLLGRFLGPMRSLMPAVAGVMGMAEKKFQLANVLSAALWIPALMAPGAMAMAFVTNLAQVKRSWYMFFFQHMIADLVVPANDLAFIDMLWADWSPGHDATEDLGYVKAALRDELIASRERLATMEAEHHQRVAEIRAATQARVDQVIADAQHEIGELS